MYSLQQYTTVAVYSVQFSVAVYSVQCSVYSVQCTVHSVQCIMYSVQQPRLCSCDDSTVSIASDRALCLVVLGREYSCTSVESTARCTELELH